MMGANIAGDLAAEQLGEAVIGYSVKEQGEVLAKLFDRPYFNITLTQDVVSDGLYTVPSASIVADMH